MTFPGSGPGSGRSGNPLHKPGRLLSVDAVRGIAMVFVGISHISLYVSPYSKSWAELLKWAGFFATPNFLLMSGFACGYQLARAGTSGAVARIVDRGLFVLLVGHVLVAGSLVYVATPGTAFEHIMITDTIGLLLCTAPLIRILSPSQALKIGSVIFLASSIVALTWQPDSSVGVLIGEFLFDIRDPANPEAGWLSPTLPYFGLFMLGSACGKLMFSNRGSERESRTYKTFMAVGVIGIAVGVGLNVGAHFLKPVLDLDSGWANLLIQTFDVRHKNPPSFAYAVFYGGAGLGLVGLIGYLGLKETPSVIARTARFPAVLGRASFITYVGLQWMIDFVPEWVGFETWLTPSMAAIYLELVVITAFGIAYVWDRNDANRLLTLGLNRPPRIAGQRAALATSLVLAFGLNAMVIAWEPQLIPPKLGLLTSDPRRWQNAIHAFDTRADIASPPRDGVVFVGSSSIRLWDLQRWFPRWSGEMINRGFGGSYLSDSVYYVDKLVIANAPRVVVVYAGDNDLDAGISSQQVAKDFARFEERVHRALPRTHIIFISIKPGLARSRNARAIHAANEDIRAYCQTHPGVTFLDISPQMMSPNGQLRTELFQADGIHLNQSGYEIWSVALTPVLDEELAGPQG